MIANLLFYIFLLFSNSPDNCTCWFSSEEKDVIEIANKADYIAQVKIASEYQPTGTEGKLHDITFVPLKLYKGSQKQDMSFIVKEDPCPYASYTVGEYYIIFGYQKGKSLETNNCNSFSLLSLNKKETGESDDVFHEWKAQRRMQYESIIMLIEKELEN